MAKFFLVILAICFLGASGVRFTEDKVAFKNATWKKCQEQENAPDEGMKEFYAFNSMEGLKDHKCAVKCINEEYGLYLKNGTISRPRLVQIIHYLSKDPNTREKLIATTDECIASVDKISEPCQKNYELSSCYLSNMKKRGINIA